jgi:hypothetical protein
MAEVEIESHEFLRWIPAPWAEHRPRPDEWFRANAHRFLFHSEHVVASAVVYELGNGPNSGGVYFLIYQNEIVYVGISCDISARLVQHKRDGRAFDRYWCIGGLPEGFAQMVETFYIHVFRPVGNEKYPPRNLLIRPFIIEALGRDNGSRDRGATCLRHESAIECSEHRSAALLE